MSLIFDSTVNSSKGLIWPATCAATKSAVIAAIVLTSSFSRASTCKLSLQTVAADSTLAGLTSTNTAQIDLICSNGKHFSKKHDSQIAANKEFSELLGAYSSSWKLLGCTKGPGKLNQDQTTTECAFETSKIRSTDSAHTENALSPRNLTQCEAKQISLSEKINSDAAVAAISAGVFGLTAGAAIGGMTAASSAAIAVPAASSSQGAMVGLGMGGGASLPAAGAVSGFVIKGAATTGAVVFVASSTAALGLGASSSIPDQRAIDRNLFFFRDIRNGAIGAEFEARAQGILMSLKQAEMYFDPQTSSIEKLKINLASSSYFNYLKANERQMRFPEHFFHIDRIKAELKLVGQAYLENDPQFDCGIKPKDLYNQISLQTIYRLINKFYQP